MISIPSVKDFIDIAKEIKASIDKVREPLDDYSNSFWDTLTISPPRLSTIGGMLST